MKVILEFEDSHHYEEEFEFEENIYCSNCGHKGIWEEQGCGDYYYGNITHCTSCFSTGRNAGLMNVEKDEEYIKVIEQLKTGITNKPTTRKGN